MRRRGPRSRIRYIQYEPWGFAGLTTDETGAEVERISYDPWGRARDADDWNTYLADDATDELQTWNSYSYVQNRRIINAGTTRIVTVENVAGNIAISELRSALPHMVQAAREAGMKTLQVNGRFPNGRLQNFMFKQARELGGIITEGSTDTISFTLGAL